MQAREDEERLELLRRDAARIGISVGSTRMAPTAPQKWDNMIVDPDGFVWLKPWRPWSMQTDQLTVWVIDPASGAVDSVDVDAFPRAFLPDGEFVAVEIGELDSPMIRKYGFSDPDP